MQFISRINQRIVNQFNSSLIIRQYAYNPSSRVNREGKIWRRERKLPSHINQTKGLMEGADFRYVDHRPTPYGSREYRRIMNQRALATQVVQLLEEINYAESRSKNKQLEKEKEVKNILARKLKPKGGVVPSAEKDIDV